MTEIHQTATNRVLVVDDEPMLINEYLRCLGADYEPDSATSTLTELEKVLFGAETDERGAATFFVETQNQGEAAVEAVRLAIEADRPFLAESCRPPTRYFSLRSHFMQPSAVN